MFRVPDVRSFILAACFERFFKTHFKSKYNHFYLNKIAQKPNDVYLNLENIMLIIPLCNSNIRHARVFIIFFLYFVDFQRMEVLRVQRNFVGIIFDFFSLFIALLTQICYKSYKFRPLLFIEKSHSILQMKYGFKEQTNQYILVQGDLFISYYKTFTHDTAIHKTCKYKCSQPANQLFRKVAFA